ncbi:MAG TPA: Zn-dependent hydrolase, partial [Acidobacteriota bacterium]|nr:Zn-dependent hydrolase [Acidobacteriota bacterium]
TLTGQGTVRTALKELASALEEGKADILGLYMITQLIERDELEDADLKDHYVTFMAGIIRSIRFGSSSAHGRANLMRFNYFKEQGAFSRDPSTNTYRVDFDRMGEAIDSLSEKILKIQGDGDYAAAKAIMARLGQLDEYLESDLARIAARGIPTDITFEQGMSVLQ